MNDSSDVCQARQQSDQHVARGFGQPRTERANLQVGPAVIFQNLYYLPRAAKASPGYHALGSSLTPCVANESICIGARSTSADPITLRSTIRRWVNDAAARWARQPHDGARRLPRFAWSGWVVLLVDGSTLFADANDISCAGLGVVAEIAVCEEDLVYVGRDPDDPWIPARVRHATARSGAYRMGLEFDPGCAAPVGSLERFRGPLRRIFR